MNPQEFYTWSSLGTLAIAAGAVIVASNTLRTLFKIDSPWIPFAVSLIITAAGAYAASKLKTPPDWVLTILNACLLFCTATGAQQGLVAAKPRPEGEPRPYGSHPVKWLTPWFKAQ